MSAQFLLPCPKCDHKIPVDAKHAGSMRVCTGCNAEVDIPKLRELKQYSTQPDGPVSKPSSQASGGLPVKGLLFSIGLLLLAIAGGIGGYIYYSSTQRFVDVNVDQMIEQTEADIDSVPPADLFDSWQSRPEELGSWQEFDFVRRNREAKVLRNIAFACFGVAGFGLLMVLSSFAVK